MKIYVVPIHRPRMPNLEFLAEAISKHFHIPATVLALSLDLERAYDRYRNQYHSTDFLSQLLDLRPDDGVRILGVTDLDLFIPILTYVFGEAQLDGHAAVISCHRLRNELYGLPADNKLLQSRLLKEAIHELGHTFGLVHCQNPTCVMRVSTYVEEIDFKGVDFCPDCQTQVQEAVENVRNSFQWRMRRASE